MNTNHVFNPRILSSASAKAYYKAFSKEVQMHPEVDADIISHVLLAYLTMSINKGVNVTYDIGGISPCMGGVSISGKTIIFNNANLFKDAKNLATNFEVYPKIDGTIQMNFGFHGLKRKDGNN